MTADDARAEVERSIKQLDDFTAQYLMLQAIVGVNMRRYVAILAAERSAELQAEPS